MKCFQGNTKTLRVVIWNVKSHSHFLKVWCSGYIPDLLNRLPKTEFYFTSIFNSLFMKVEFRAKWGHKLLFCLYGLLSCLRTVCCYYAVASLCSSFYSAWGKKTKGVDICNLFNQACTKYSAKYSTDSIWPSYMESCTRFSQGPLSILELSKDPPKDKEDFNRFCHTSFCRFRKNSFFWRLNHFFAQQKFPQNVHAVSLGPDDSP